MQQQSSAQTISKGQRQEIERIFARGAGWVVSTHLDEPRGPEPTTREAVRWVLDHVKDSKLRYRGDGIFTVDVDKGAQWYTFKVEVVPCEMGAFTQQPCSNEADNEIVRPNSSGFRLCLGHALQVWDHIRKQRMAGWERRPLPPKPYCMHSRISERTDGSKVRRLSCAETAQLVRAELKKQWPRVTFSVRSSTYSGGASIDVRWKGGPDAKAVKQAVSRFEGATFDGMTDLKSYHDSWLDGERVHFGADFIFCQRED